MKEKRREIIVLNRIGPGLMESMRPTGVQYSPQVIISGLLKGFLWNPLVVAYQGEELSGDRLSFSCDPCVVLLSILYQTARRKSKISHDTLSFYFFDSCSPSRLETLD